MSNVTKLYVFLLFAGLAFVIIASILNSPIVAEKQVGAGGVTEVALLPMIIKDPTPTPTATPIPAPPTSITLVPVATGFQGDTITDIAHADDGRLFVAERQGIIRVVQPDGTILPTPFLDITQLVGWSFNWEMGLLGLAFHPNYPTVPYFYVAYTQPTSPIVLARYTVNPATPDVADPGSAVILLYIEKPADEDGNPSPVHNGGDLNFGPHGYLYVSWGDGGPDPVPNNGIPGDPFNNSQRTNTMLGKIIRLDVDSTSGTPPDCGDSGYVIPPGNPYTDGPGEDCDEIWATGLRNPWRFSFDRLTGDMYIGDVGEWEREEIDFQPAGLPAGLNYGWHCFEGTINYETLYPQVGLDCGGPELYTPPIFEYEHTPSGGFSTVGGFVYRGSQYPSLYGYYVTADFNGNMWVLRQEDGVWVSRFLGNAGRFISTFGEGVDGELYVGVWDPSPNTTPTLYHVTTP